MDHDETLKSNAQNAEQEAQIDNQKKASESRGYYHKDTFDSSVLDAWTSGVSMPHDFNSKSSEEVERVKGPQEIQWESMQKEDKAKKAK